MKRSGAHFGEYDSDGEPSTMGIRRAVKRLHTDTPSNNENVRQHHNIQDQAEFSGRAYEANVLYNLGNSPVGGTASEDYSAKVSNCRENQSQPLSVYPSAQHVACVSEVAHRPSDTALLQRECYDQTLHQLTDAQYTEINRLLYALHMERTQRGRGQEVGVTCSVSKVTCSSHRTPPLVELPTASVPQGLRVSAP
ncbi:hypothetical protein CYMTET_39245 [Cymbomonas tetramitiformis]|uniref:Uncharacterized protein n=1 Tax=Cymbomonas tetramitiformis TaxID=36881 RepID=A0AAE0CBV9_9CHLO|nr:hypothetical protein CYMTET_39245 [Cymbomonas tetramitiformis]